MDDLQPKSDLCAMVKAMGLPLLAVSGVNGRRCGTLARKPSSGASVLVFGDKDVSAAGDYRYRLSIFAMGHPRTGRWWNRCGDAARLIINFWR